MVFRELEMLKKVSGPILITGHTGFKGAWLTLMLENLGIPTCGYSLPAAENSLYNVLQREGSIYESFSDIRDFNSVKTFLNNVKPSVIIHLAAQPLVLDSYSDPRTTFTTNVDGTINVIDAAFQSNSVEVILVATTDKVYKTSNTINRFIESDPLEGNDPYSSSKVATEAVVRGWQKLRSVTSGPKLLAARSGNVIGGGDFADNRLMPDLMKGFHNNEKVIIRNSLHTRPWQHVIDPLLGYLKYIEHALGNETVSALNFGPSEKSLTVRAVTELAQSTWESETKVEYENHINERESKFLELNSSLAVSILNWKPNWSQQQAVMSTVKWWKKYMYEKIKPIELCASDINEILK